jgi:RNA processing factor Prp31
MSWDWTEEYRYIYRDIREAIRLLNKVKTLLKRTNIPSLEYYIEDIDRLINEIPKTIEEWFELHPAE